ncbi:MAG: alcohol dehydrogenase [Burkholderiaceae bacterium]
MLSYDVTEWGKPLQKALRETPKPEGTEVLVRIRYCGICHSDVHIRDGYFDMGGGKKFYMTERGMNVPRIMGHEPFGTVVAGGPDAGELPLGKDVLVYPWTGCGKCARCAEGMDNWCQQPQYLGIQRNGGYADHLIVPHSRYLVDASGIEPSFAPILACSGLTTYSAVRKLAPSTPKDWVLVLGAGGLGLMAIAMLRALGHENIAVADVDARKFDAARAMGASVTVDPSSPEAVATLQALEGGVVGATDFVGVAQTAQLGQAVLRKGGRYVLVGLYGGEITVSLVALAQRAMTIQGSYVGSLAELEEVVALARSGKLKSIPVETVPLEQVSEVLDQLKAGTIIGRKVAKID